MLFLFACYGLVACPGWLPAADGEIVPTEPSVVHWAPELPSGYPNWTEDQQAELRKKGQDVLGAVRAASAARQGTIVIPPGDYLFDANWSRASTLRELADLQIVADGVSFWFEPPLVHGLLFEDCRNVSVRGLSIDCTMPCWFQAEVIEIDRGRQAIQARITPGYEPRDSNGDAQTEGERDFVFYDARGRFINRRHASGAWRLSADGRHVTFHDIRGSGIPPTLAVGDFVVATLRRGAAVRSIRCAGMRFEDVAIWSSPGAAVYEAAGAGGNVYRRVRATRRPATNRLHAFGADVFHLADTDCGPTLERCEIAHGADDVLNIHGSFGRVVERVDDRHYHLDGAYAEGDIVEFWDHREISPLGTATVVAVKPSPTVPTVPINERYTARGEWLVHLDKALELPALTLVVLDGKRSAAGFVVRECRMHDTFQRVLINGAPGGLIEGNTFQNLGSGLHVQFETWGPWMEGPFARDLCIRNNRFLDGPPDAPAIRVSMHSAGGGSDQRRFPAMPVRNLAIEGNVFDGTAIPALDIHNVQGLTIRGNRVVHPAGTPSSARDGVSADADWYVLQDCQDVVVSDNEIVVVPDSARNPVHPNIVWFVVDDMSADLSCYRPLPIATPHIDRLAREGTRFTHAYTTAPVCSPSRSAMITGMYQNAIGAQHHRSGRGVHRIYLPDGVQPVPVLFQRAGYYTCIGDGVVDDEKRAAGKKRPARGKTDYNFEWDPAMYDGEDWDGRGKGQPFFMQVMLPGGKIRDGGPGSLAAASTLAAERLGSAVRPEDVELPPYLPRDPVLLADRVAYLDAVRLTDHHVGQVLARLEAEGVLENTLVIFMTDHGVSHARAKQFLYDEGTHIPFIVRGPGVPRGEVREDLVEQIDMAPTSLAAAGIPIPGAMQGRDLFAPDGQPREAVFAARDRCDETVDRIRSVRTDRVLYIRNFHPQRPLLQPNAYKDAKPTLEALRRLHAKGELPPLAERILFSPTRPAEELYLWHDDPWQLTNLADDPAHRGELEACRARLDSWMREMRDPVEEPEAQYDSDMAVYVGAGNPEVERNIATMKRLAAEEGAAPVAEPQR